VEETPSPPSTKRRKSSVSYFLFFEFYLFLQQQKKPAKKEKKSARLEKAVDSQFESFVKTQVKLCNFLPIKHLQLTELTKLYGGLKKDINAMRKKEKPASVEATVEKLRKIKTSTAPELLHVKIPPEVGAELWSKDQELLWKGGVFCLPRDVKTKMAGLCKNPKAYYKAKLQV
jgi:hypothetical protein